MSMKFCFLEAAAEQKLFQSRKQHRSVIVSPAPPFAFSLVLLEVFMRNVKHVV
jgi:hypothetical protein